MLIDYRLLRIIALTIPPTQSRVPAGLRRILFPVSLHHYLLTRIVAGVLLYDKKELGRGRNSFLILILIGETRLV